MIVLNAEQIRMADAFTIKNEPVESIDLMERASLAFSDYFCSLFNKNEKVVVICGTGNNGGDGLAVSRILIQRGYLLTAVVVGEKSSGSKDFKTNLSRLKQTNPPIIIDSSQGIIDFTDFDVVIDAIFGSGLTRPINGLHGQVIDKINASKSIKIAVDIASGLYVDHASDGEHIIQADYTVSFQLPKLSFFIPSNQHFVGEWTVVDIGLDVNFINAQHSNYFMLDYEGASRLLKGRSKFAHKGSFGHGLLIGGSFGKIGAMVMGANAFMRSGAGLLTTHIPYCGYNIMQTTVPEAMVLTDASEQLITENKLNKKYSAVGIGPGLGTDPQTDKAVKEALMNNTSPMVIDADGLNILAKHSELLELLVENTILTPHTKEFERLAGEAKSDWERLELARSFAMRHRVILVLKGAHTAVINNSGEVYFNSTGNPGMATAGSGDVLTGIIAALLSQGYPPFDAARLGVYVHGLAGDQAALDLGEISMNATDIINYLPDAFVSLKAQPF